MYILMSDRINIYVIFYIYVFSIYMVLKTTFTFTFAITIWFSVCYSVNVLLRLNFIYFYENQ